MKKPKILITNDDGINAKGIKVLIELLKPHGELLVVAPDKGQSAMSHAITIKNPLHLKKIKEEKNLTIYSCTGTSVDCVKLAINELESEKPDFIFSGTMAAALEGSIHGITSVGLSVLDYAEDADFTAAQHFTKQLIEKILAGSFNNGACLNVNFPNVGIEDIKGIKVCRQAKSAWVESFDKRTDPHKRHYYWLTGKFHNYEPEAKDTDDWALRNHYVSVVPVQTDFTDHQRLNEFKKLEE